MKQKLLFPVLMLFGLVLFACSPDAGKAGDENGENKKTSNEEPESSARVKKEMNESEGDQASSSRGSESARNETGGTQTNGSNSSKEETSTSEEDGPKKLTEEQKKRLRERMKKARKKQKSKPPAPSIEVSDEELRRLARLSPKLRKVSIQTRKEIQSTVRDSEMKEERFKEISRSKNSKGKGDVQISKEEEALYQNLVKKLRKINRAGKKKHMKLVREAGFKPKRLQKIAQAIKRDKKLRQRFMKVRKQMNSSSKKKGSGTPESGETSSSSSPEESSSESESSSGDE